MTNLAPVNHRIYMTDDGPSLYSENYAEAFHNSAGAKGETLHNFIEGCEIGIKARKGSINILEIGLGTGLGYALTCQELLGYQGKFTFITCEKDPALVEWAKQQNIPSCFPNFSDFKRVGSILKASKNRYTLIVLLGDATSTLSEAKLPPIDAIYHDPFSPKKNPELWSKEFFLVLKKLSSSKGILSTYSAASSIRTSLKQAGFRVERRAGFAFKRESTRAFPQ